MTRDEFLRWFTEHCAAFTSCRLEFCRHPDDDDRPGVVTKKMILSQWYAALSDVAYEDAARVTKAWAKGDPEPPKWFDEHRPAVRKLAKSYERERVLTNRLLAMPTASDDELPRFRCHECQDNESGRVSVYSWRCMKAAADDGAWSQWGKYTKGVLCSCHHGRELAEAEAKRRNVSVERIVRLRPWMVKQGQHFEGDDVLRQRLIEAMDAKEASEAKAVEWGGQYERTGGF